MANSKFNKLTLDFSNHNSKRFSNCIAWTRKKQIFSWAAQIDKLVDYGLNEINDR
jgi:hypothetical protein